MQRPAWWRERELASERIGRLWVGLSFSALLAALPQPFIVNQGGAETGWEPGPQGGIASSSVSEEKWKIESAE